MTTKTIELHLFPVDGSEEEETAVGKNDPENQVAFKILVNLILILGSRLW